MSARRVPDDGGDKKPGKPEVKRGRLATRLRNYFLTGLVIAAPISITIYLTWSFINAVDRFVKPLIPRVYNPETYLPFGLPGLGLIFAFVFLVLLGFLTASLIGRSIVNFGESLVDSMPFVRTIYRALKQIFETVLSQTNNSFQQVGLMEYPRKGVWAIVFVSTEASGEIPHKVSARTADGEPMLAVFMPSTPNPTTGFLMMVPERDVILLDMTVEEAAKFVISAGLVTPDYTPEGDNAAEKVADVVSEAANELERRRIESDAA